MTKDFDALRYALSDAEMPYGYGDHAAKKSHDMSEDEAAELAHSIFAMFFERRAIRASARRSRWGARLAPLTA